MRPSSAHSWEKGLELQACFLLLGLSLIHAQQLKFVNILFRHGDRSPSITYPTDPWKEAFPEGWSQLTNTGKRQEFELGQYFRQRYGSLLNLTRYIPPQIKMKSSDVDRTLMSASCLLAGMFPPAGREVWNLSIKWQPLPIHGVPLLEDYLFNGYEVCQKFSHLLQESKLSEEADEFNEKNKDLFDLITNKTGLNITDLFKACDVYDLFVVHQAHQLAWPDWVDNSTMESLEQCLIKNHILSTKTQLQRRLNGGVIVGEWIRNMQDRIDGNDTTRKIKMYSGHDWNIIYLLTSLDMYNYKRAPYGAAVFMELLEDKDQHFVKIFYRNSTTVEPYELSIPKCPTPCLFEDFKKLTADVIPEDYVKECSMAVLKTTLHPMIRSWPIGVVIFCSSTFFILAILFTVVALCPERSQKYPPLLAGKPRRKYSQSDQP